MEIITHRERKVETHYSRDFRWKDSPGAGFGFDCDKDGNMGELNPDAAANLAKCLDGTFDVVDKGIVSWESDWIEPAVGKCSCGREVVLHDPLDNECDCGLCFNSGGQQVTPSWKCDDQGNPYDY